MCETSTTATTYIVVVIIDSLHQEMPVKEIVGSTDDSPPFGAGLLLLFVVYHTLTDPL